MGYTSHLTLENLGQKQDVRFTRAVVSMPAVEPENRRIETRFIPESEHCPVNWTAFLLHYKWNQWKEGLWVANTRSCQRLSELSKLTLYTIVNIIFITGFENWEQKCMVKPYSWVTGCARVAFKTMNIVQFGRRVNERWGGNIWNSVFVENCRFLLRRSDESGTLITR